MKAKIKLPTHAIIIYFGNDCGARQEKCPYLDNPMFSKHPPYGTVEPTCHLFNVKLKSHTVDLSNGAEDGKLMVDRMQYYFQPERCDPCKKAADISKKKGK